MDREDLLKRYYRGESDFSRADLSYANLIGANLSGSNLSYADLSYADLRCANLSGANLSDANLRGANIDHASWPIWCGSKHVNVDNKIAMQLAAHFCTLVCDDQEVKEAQALILAFAKKSHIAHHILED